MDRTLLEDYGINYDEGFNRFLKNDDLFKKFLLKFKNDTSFEKLKQALNDDDADQAFKAAHTLKGVTANLAMRDLAEVAHNITAALREGYLEKGKAYIPKVEEKYNRMLELMDILEKE